VNTLRHITDLFDRLGSYPWWEVAFELLLIWVLVYIIVRFVQGTRAAGALKGILFVLFIVVLLLMTLGGGEAFGRLEYIVNRVLAVVAVGLIVIFQPELRRAAIRIGEAPFFRSTPSDISRVIESIADSGSYLCKNRFGAIIVLERQVKLEHLVEGGTRIDAEISGALLKTIFFPGSALHDLAVVVRGRVVHSANVQLPLADPADMPDPGLGARHRAAVGLTKECDAIVVVVSEESGLIRVAERGRLGPTLDADQLKTELTARLNRTPPSEGKTGADEEEERATMQADPADEPQRSAGESAQQEADDD
jgi:diadenylate cyclase